MNKYITKAIFCLQVYKEIITPKTSILSQTLGGGERSENIIVYGRNRMQRSTSSSDKQKGRQTDRQTGRQTDRHTGRQADRYVVLWLKLIWHKRPIEILKCGTIAFSTFVRMLMIICIWWMDITAAGRLNDFVLL